MKTLQHMGDALALEAIAAIKKACEVYHTQAEVLSMLGIGTMLSDGNRWDLRVAARQMVQFTRLPP